ncbi:MAG: ABC transporter substrate-binding protein [Deltaproteobacteria bacterium]|nr:ABC transporter substrate-binding protein [Deltaproteobacteria bacterium]
MASFSLFALLLTLFVVFCTPLHAQEKIKFPMAVSSKTLGYGPLWIASKQGFFDRQGLDVQLVVVRGSDKSVQALVGGSVQVLSSGADGPIAAKENGIDLVMIGGTINGLTHFIMGSKNIKTYENLRGATIGATGVNSGTTIGMREALKQKGIEPREYTVIGTGGSGPAFAALSSGQVTAALIAVPLNYAAADMGFNTIGRVADLVPHYQVAGLAVYRSLAEKNRPVIVRFMKAIILAHRWLYENKEAAIAFLAKEMDMKPEYARRGWEYYTEQKIWPRDGDLSVEGVKFATQVYWEQTQNKSPLPPPQKYVDQSFLREATKELSK